MYRESYGVEQRLLPDLIEETLAIWLARTAGFVLCLVGLAGWLSLLTWSVSDPSLTHASLGPARNLLGGPGAIVSDLLLQLFGLAAVFLALAPFLWGSELISMARVPHFRLRLVLLPLALLALAAGFSALPTSASWPLHHGFGGIVGDLLYNLCAAALAAVLSARSGVIAGLVLFSGGLAAITACVVLGSQPFGRWQIGAGLRRSTPGLGWRRPRGIPRGSPDPAFAPVLGGHWPDLPARSPAQPHPSPAEPTPKVPIGESLSRADPRRPDADDDLGPREPEFDVSTDIESRRIAERFAPANGPREKAEARSAPSLLNGLALRRTETGFRLPSLNMLKRRSGSRQTPEVTQSVLRGTARLLEDVLADYGVKGEIKDIRPGPVVTLYELEPARGIKSSRVIGLAEDIARSMSATAVRVAVVPGRNVIGIEIPNAEREPVLLREMLESEAFRACQASLPLALGKSIGGDPVVVDLARMPHLLVAGTTGSGKSVGINAMVLSLLYKLPPENCRLLMIDPKMLELSVYNGVPHLLTPVVTDPHKAVAALNWAVREMEERYKRMASLGVRSIDVFNNRVRHSRSRGDLLKRTVQTGFDRHTGQAVFETEHLDLEPMPHIVVVVDEFADLMIVAGKEIESAVQRLAQMARAAGIHLIMATQRPSVDIITGTIKANFPTRISFKVTSKIDSRTILNEQGAEQLLGQGDMLFSSGSGQLVRLHGPFVSDDEVENIAAFLRQQGEPRYIEGVTDGPPADDERQPRGADSDAEADLYDKAVALVLRDRKASTSYLQRRLSIGYNRAADLIERMERAGIISAASATGKREILSGGLSPGMPST